jgi:hypothetical protein
LVLFSVILIVACSGESFAQDSAEIQTPSPQSDAFTETPIPEISVDFQSERDQIGCLTSLVFLPAAHTHPVLDSLHSTSPPENTDVPDLTKRGYFGLRDPADKGVAEILGEQFSDVAIDSEYRADVSYYTR